MVIKIQEFKENPKRKYVRKAKVVKEEEDEMFDLDNIIKSDQSKDQIKNDIFGEYLHTFTCDSAEVNELSKNVKKLKISDLEQIEEDKSNKVTFIPIQNKKLQNQLSSSNYINTKIDYNEFKEIKNIIHIHQYEFLSKVDLYLYYIIEPLGNNITKHLYYTSIYNTLSGYIMIPTKIPKEYKKKSISIEEDHIELVPNVILHIKRIYIKKGEYIYEECNNNLTRKRKIDINNDWSYDFCQLRMKGLNNIMNQKFVFKYENSYITFEYKIKTKFSDVNLDSPEVSRLIALDVNLDSPEVSRLIALDVNPEKLKSSELIALDVNPEKLKSSGLFAQRDIIFSDINDV
jgi:hypothetical protein